MKIASRASRLVVQFALLLALLSTSAFVLLRNYLDDPERLYENGKIDQVVSKGPVTVDHVDWTLNSLQAYTKLIDTDGEPIDLPQPAGSVIMVATMTVTPREGTYLKDKGFQCAASLTDDRGNTWDGQQPYKFKLPTYCTNDDFPWTLNKPGQIAQVYVVPASAVPHLTGVLVGDSGGYFRVMITP
ncbi:hypothetical protein [Kribbella sp. NPDC055071]